MVFKKSWIWENRQKSIKDYYTGWFLLGIIPLYIVRDRKKMVKP